jgi:hypothetical protein
LNFDAKKQPQSTPGLAGTVAFMAVLLRGRILFAPVFVMGITEILSIMRPIVKAWRSWNRRECQV